MVGGQYSTSGVGTKEVEGWLHRIRVDGVDSPQSGGGKKNNNKKKLNHHNTTRLKQKNNNNKTKLMNVQPATVCEV